MADGRGNAIVFQRLLPARHTVPDMNKLRGKNRHDWGTFTQSLDITLHSTTLLQWLNSFKHYKSYIDAVQGWSKHHSSSCLGAALIC